MKIVGWILTARPALLLSFSAVIWGGLFLHEPRLCALMPLVRK